MDQSTEAPAYPEQGTPEYEIAVAQCYIDFEMEQYPWRRDRDALAYWTGRLNRAKQALTSQQAQA